MASVDAFLISDRSSFQSRWVATLNARSPNLSLVRGTARSPLEADRNLVCRSSPETGCSMSSMYVGELPVTDWYTSVQSLNSIRAATGSQCRSISAGVTWSRGRRPSTRRPAEFNTRCNGAIVDSGSHVCVVLAMWADMLNSQSNCTPKSRTAISADTIVASTTTTSLSVSLKYITQLLSSLH